MKATVRPTAAFAVAIPSSGELVLMGSPMTRWAIVSATRDPRAFRASDGSHLVAPPDWECLPPGDAGLTRRVKQAGIGWQVVETRGRRVFSRGFWAPAPVIRAARAALAAERSTPAHAQRLLADRARRDREQARYVGEFTQEVLAFLRFSPRWHQLAIALAARVAEHATPVGSGTVARTKRIPVARRAEAAVLAWMRHQTTRYDSMAVPRIKGARRQVRRGLAEVSRAMLALHRTEHPHSAAECPLCSVLESAKRSVPLEPRAVPVGSDAECRLVTLDQVDAGSDESSDGGGAPLRTSDASTSEPSTRNRSAAGKRHAALMALRKKQLRTRNP